MNQVVPNGPLRVGAHIPGSHPGRHQDSSGLTLAVRHALAGRGRFGQSGNGHCEWHGFANPHGRLPSHESAPAGRGRRTARGYPAQDNNTGLPRDRHIRSHPRRNCQEPLLGRHRQPEAVPYRPPVAVPPLRRARPLPPVHQAQQHSRITTPILRPRQPW
jgi:hypothetical protein